MFGVRDDALSVLWMEEDSTPVDWPLGIFIHEVERQLQAISETHVRFQPPSAPRMSAIDFLFLLIFFLLPSQFGSQSSTKEFYCSVLKSDSCELQSQ